MSNYFKGLREAKISDRPPYFEPNQTYEVKLLKTFVLETREKGDAFIAEFEVIKSSSPNQRPGSVVAFYQGLTKKDVAFANIKQLVYAVLGVDPTKDADKIAREVDPEIENEMQKAIEKNHMAGARVKCVTSTRKSQKGVDFTQHRWSPLA